MKFFSVGCKKRTHGIDPVSYTHLEKFDRFNERLRENRSNMSKREVSNYMQKQRREEENEVSAFAAAWEKAMKGE